MEDLKKLVAQAAAELGVNVPVLRAERQGSGLKLWLYGRGDKPVTWTPKTQAQAEQAQAKPKPAKRTVKE